MLNLYHAPDLETLGTLATGLLSLPQSDPLAPDWVVVPSQGMGRWLTLELAQVSGIAMHLELQLPARFIWDLSRWVLGTLPEQSAFTPAVLGWRLYGWLHDAANLSKVPPLARYLEGGDERRRLSLAVHIADVFDQYLLYRDDWLATWERGELVGLGADESWQALLWRELTREGHPHRARLLNDLLHRLFNEQPMEGLPERVLVFGISSLPVHHLRVLEGLARHTNVLIFALNPCREVWGDIRDIRELARETPAVCEPDDWYLDLGNPLLASLGKQGRDFFDQLLGVVAETGQEQGFFSEDAHLQDVHLLRALQNDVQRLRTRSAEERLELDPNDRSLEVHVAHSPLREVEILHDQLLARFQDDPKLTPDQVVVLTPDIEIYAPFIQAVFAPREGVPRIPYSLADRSLRAEVPLIECFLGLLGLPDSRFAAEEILAWLQQPAMAQAAGIDETELSLIRDWLRAAGVRWGRDARHRQRLGLPPEEAFTWRQGLDRLLLGFAAPPELAADAPPLMGSHWPIDALEGSHAQLLGRLVAFIERLGYWADQLSQARPLHDWADTLQHLLDALFAEQAAEEVLLQLSQACASLREQAEASGLALAVPLELVRQQLGTLLEHQGRATGFLNGAVTFCTMVPMRSLPFRMVCLLGLNDGALPRRTPAPGFDLIARHPRRGDRARRLDDRYLLLESLLSAREALYLSYVGRDPRTNQALPPSVLVNEILEAVDLTACLPNSSDRPSQQLVVSHPLQPFAPANFGTGRQRGFAKPWFIAAQTLASPACVAEPFAGPSVAVAGNETRVVEPRVLVSCMTQPARFFLEQCLGLRLPEEVEAIAASEPFELDWHARREVRQLALTAWEKGWSTAVECQLAEATGWLPTGSLGLALWGAERGPIQAFAPHLMARQPTADPQPVRIDVCAEAVQVQGWLEGVTPEGLFRWKLSPPSDWDRVSFWLRHLLLNLLPDKVQVQRTSQLLTPEEAWHLAAMGEEEALEQLRPWLNAYKASLHRPLPLFPRTSQAFAQALHRAKGDVLAEARKKARAAWEGCEQKPGEQSDAWNALAFRDHPVLDEHFESLAKTLFLPLCQQLQVEKNPR